jgi:hypothetical protein
VCEELTRPLIFIVMLFGLEIPLRCLSWCLTAAFLFGSWIFGLGHLTYTCICIRRRASGEDAIFERSGNVREPTVIRVRIIHEQTTTVDHQANSEIVQTSEVDRNREQSVIETNFSSPPVNSNVEPRARQTTGSYARSGQPEHRQASATDDTTPPSYEEAVNRLNQGLSRTLHVNRVVQVPQRPPPRSLYEGAIYYV